MAKSKKSNSNLTNALLYIVVGLLFCILRSGAMNILFTIVGALLIVKGVMDVLAKNVTPGVIAIAAGVAVIALGWFLVKVALLILGVIILIKSVQNLLDVLKKKHTTLELVGAILAAVIGVMLIASGWMVLDWLFIIIGVALIADGGMVLYKEYK